MTERPAQGPLKVLFLAAEVVPFAKTGGLADVAGALPKAMAALGHDIRVGMPRYGRIRPEQFNLQDVLGKGPFEDWDQEAVEMVLAEVYTWSCEVLGPLNRVADAQGCRVEDGRVKTPAGFKEAWKSFYDAGWGSLAMSSAAKR